MRGSFYSRAIDTLDMNAAFVSHPGCVQSYRSYGLEFTKRKTALNKGRAKRKKMWSGRERQMTSPHQAPPFLHVASEPVRKILSKQVHTSEIDQNLQQWRLGGT
jgi:hypothetical protein